MAGQQSTTKFTQRRFIGIPARLFPQAALTNDHLSCCFLWPNWKVSDYLAARETPLYATEQQERAWTWRAYFKHCALQIFHPLVANLALEARRLDIVLLVFQPFKYPRKSHPDLRRETFSPGLRISIIQGGSS